MTCIWGAALLPHKMLSTHLSLWFTVLLRRLRNIQPPASICQLPAWDKNKPLISVVIPCFNHGHYLAEAVDSVLSQTWQGFEIIVVNDGSTDPETNQILVDFQRPKTRIIHLPQNRGLPAARNAGIEQARGKYICCLDADDKLQETYLEKAILVMEVNAGISFVWPWTQVFGAEDRVWYTPQFDLRTLIYHNQLNASAVFRKSAWQSVGGFDDEMRDGFEDWEFWIRLAGHGLRGFRISEKLFLCRRTGYGFASRAAEMRAELFAQVQEKNPQLYTHAEEILASIERSYLNNYTAFFLHNLGTGEWLPIEPATLVVSSLDSRATLNWLRAEARSVPLIWAARQPLDEAALDALFTVTPYVYILPNFLPRYAHAEFIQHCQKIWKTRSVEYISK